MTHPGTDARPRGLLAAVFLISVASLSLEVLQMRVFAFALWHHLAFLVISIAILGFGASGAVLASFKRLREKDAGDSAAFCGLAFAATVWLGPLYISSKRIDIFADVGSGEFFAAVLYYVLFASPYFFAGYIVSIALMRMAAQAGKLYFLNMIGSGIGCFVIFATLRPLAAEGSFAMLASVGALVAAISATGRTLRIASIVAFVALLCTIPFATKFLTIRPAASKLMARAIQTGREPKFFEWTPLCRIDIVLQPGTKTSHLFQDGDAPSLFPLSAREGRRGIHTLGYNFVTNPRVLAIGAGGGKDILTAYHHDAKSVVGIEINPTTHRLSLDPEFSAAATIADLPHVDFVNAEGRFYIRSSDQIYDLIQMTGVDTYTALASGAYVMSESYLYTIEAFHDYFDHLSDDGVLSIVRFAFPAPRETLRIMVMACQALRDQGAAEPWRHIAIMKRGQGAVDGSSPFVTVTSMGAIVVKKSPFTDADLKRLREVAGEIKLIRDYIPGDPTTFTEEQLSALEAMAEKAPTLREYPLDESGMNPFHAFAQALMDGTEEEFLAAYPYDVAPVFDDRPFFFNQHKISSLWSWLRGSEEKLASPALEWIAMTHLFQLRPIGLIMLFLTLLQLIVLVTICIFGPLLLNRKGLSVKGIAAPLGYFACLGLGYIFLMISTMQRFGLVLGHPTYSISVVMATFLVVSGLGSLFSERFAAHQAVRLLRIVAGVLVLGAVFLHLALPALAPTMLGASFPVRVLFTMSMVSPMAFVMGMCFPTGIRMVAKTQESLVPWSYGVNGAASVLGSVLAVVLAMALGFQAVQWIAAGLYVLAAFFLARMAKSAA